MPQLQFKKFNNPRKKRCDCCDCVLPLANKVLVFDEELLAGDLELCEQCTRLLLQACGGSRETVLTEWDFGKE